MPAARDRPWFREALRSASEQSDPDLEIIVTDDSGGALAPYVASVGDARVRYVANAKPLGFAGNHCNALSLARGRYISFLHDDDVWPPGYLESAGKILDAHPKVGFVLNAANEIDESGRPLGPRPCILPDGVIDDPLTEFLKPDFLVMLPSSTVFRSTALAADHVVPWPDWIAADMTMFLDLAIAGWDGYFSKRNPISYRVHRGQIGTDPLAHRHALVSVWARYTFPAEKHESLRKQLLRRWLIARAGAHLRRGDAAKAKADLQEARIVGAGLSVGWRWLGLRMLSEFPGAAPFADRLWAKLYDRFAHRHTGVE